MHTSTYLPITDETSIHAHVIDAATVELVITTRFGQCVVITVPTPHDGQRFAVRVSDAVYQAQRRGPVDMVGEDRKIEDDDEDPIAARWADVHAAAGEALGACDAVLRITDDLEDAF